MNIKEAVLSVASPYPIKCEGFSDGKHDSYSFYFKSEKILYSYLLFRIYCYFGKGLYPISFIENRPKKIHSEKELIRIVKKILNSPQIIEVVETIRDWEKDADE